MAGAPAFRVLCEGWAGVVYSPHCAKFLVHSSQRNRGPSSNLFIVPWGLKRYQQTGQLHFITFSCYRRAPLLGTTEARQVFVHELERVRRWYGFNISGYVVMPEHVHLLMSEPERSCMAVILQMLKQAVSRKLDVVIPGSPFWQPRYYDFNVWSERKFVEKLRYLHRNPVTRGLVEKPEDWAWSSFQHYVTGEEGIVEVESQWTARKRERLGVYPKIKKRLAS